MKKILFIVCLFITMSSQGQTETYTSNMKAFLETTGSITYYDGVVDKLFTLLKEKYANKNVPDRIWTELEKVKPLALDNVIDLIVQAYMPLFNENDIANMTLFYKTENGKNVLSNKPLTQAESDALKAFYQTETGNKIVVNQETLNMSMKNTTQNWSGNLYLQLVDALAAEGYNL